MKYSLSKFYHFISSQLSCAALQQNNNMLKLLNRNLRRIYSRLRWPIRRRSKPKVVIIKRFGKLTAKGRPEADQATSLTGSSATVHPNGVNFTGERTLRIATFNAALFSMAPAVPASPGAADGPAPPARSANRRPKSILKTTKQQQRLARSKLRVSINLPDNEISLLRNRQLSFDERSAPAAGRLRSTVSFSAAENRAIRGGGGGGERTVVEVLRELDADILALQDVKAEEEKSMKPLSDLAAALGMNYVFAESWAPEYGNAILSKWPINRFKVQKIFDDSDFRNVLKATIDVPKVGEINFHCTHLDHLDESWRMKQINAIIQSNNEPHILVGGLNSLEESDYSQERWTDIVKYYEEMRKPTPKVEVMRYLKKKLYTDAKDFAGECESVVMIAKGQSVQGTCKYGTRVDYILASPNSPYKFVPGSYSVFSSKGTSDHHIVKVDLTKVDNNTCQETETKKPRKPKSKVIKITGSSPISKGIWKADMR